MHGGSSDNLEVQVVICRRSLMEEGPRIGCATWHPRFRPVIYTYLLFVNQILSSITSHQQEKKDRNRKSYLILSVWLSLDFISFRFHFAGPMSPSSWQWRWRSTNLVSALTPTASTSHWMLMFDYVESFTVCWVRFKQKVMLQPKDYHSEKGYPI